MPSSISSSEPDAGATYSRPLPALRVGTCAVLAVLAFVAALGAWESHWRAFGAQPTIRNSEGLWAGQRRRIDRGEGDALVIAGSSRVLFGLQLPVWEQVTGRRPIQLALEGSSPLPVLEGLAADPDFRGQLVVGVAPDVFFTGFVYRESAIARYATETLAQRAGQWLSQHLLEPWLAFYEPDFALFTVLARQAWPQRAGVPAFLDVRRLSVGDGERNTRMWDKLERDPEYAALAQRIWAQWFDLPHPGGAAGLAKGIEDEIARAAAVVAKLRARGIHVVFVRMPSDGAYLAYENRDFPRATTWDALLERTGAPGIHFEDHPALQGYVLPEWSHLSAAEADRFTAAIAPMLAATLSGTPGEPIR
jgi:hypothetical protein